MAGPGGKYTPLREYLRGLAKSEWRASFSDVEKALGFSLPPSARKYPAWWSNNDTGSRHSVAWLDAGYRTSDLNLTAETVWFRRSSASRDHGSRGSAAAPRARNVPVAGPAAAPGPSRAHAEGDALATGRPVRSAAAVSNHQRVTEAFDLLTDVLAPYVAQALRAAVGPAWWKTAVLGTLHEGQRRGLPQAGDDNQLTDQLDVGRALILMDVHWNAVFRDVLCREHRGWVKELMSTRNKWAHKGRRQMPEEDAWRALDTINRVVGEIDPHATSRLRHLAQIIRWRRTE